MDNYQILKFAGLLHDIGKFYQRADNMGMGKQSYDSKYSALTEEDYGQNGAHPKWSADFVKDYFDESVEDLVLHHHDPTKSGHIELCQMLQKADHHSAKERIESVDEQDVLNTPLTSIFSRISLNGETHEDYYIPLIALDFFNKKGLHPRKVYGNEDSDLVQEYSQLWSQFKKEFDKLKNKDFESVLAIVKKYTSTMPSAAYNAESDISLYDHLKTTTAIANCRYLFSKDDELTQEDTQMVYKIVNGDISGIQNFIYRVQTLEKASSGMSKRLRGRSLYLTLLTESVANKIINDLNLDSSNILFCGGGRFTIIAPNTSKTDKIIGEISNDVNNVFIDKFNAELFLNMVSTPASGDDLRKFDEILLKLTHLLNENKKHKFINHWNELFKVDTGAAYEVCPVCGNKSDGGLCFDCSEHEKLGGAVSNAKYLIKFTSQEKISNSLFFEKLDMGYLFKRSKNDVEDFISQNPDVKCTVYTLNDTNFLEFDIDSENVSFDFKVLGNSIPNIKGKPLYFNHLAEISKGANKLGILKMDVDNLGLIFSKGFADIGGASISRISSLSFYMDLFFSGRINQIVNKFKFFDDTHGKDGLFNEIKLEFDGGKTETIYKAKGDLPDEFNDLGFSTIHINYSGGDDLLVVGPYDDIIEFAQEFRQRFKKWTACNDSINISAGIIIASPKFPIGKAAIMADEELEKSKDCGRDKITIFGEVLSWQSKNNNYKGFADIFKFAKKLEELTSNKTISKGLVYSLLKIWKRANIDDLTCYDEKSWNDKNFEKLSTKRFVPILMYKLRLIKNKKTREDLAKQTIKYMPWIKTPVSWTSLRLR